jgi:hypothetical protein
MTIERSSTSAVALSTSDDEPASDTPGRNIFDRERVELKARSEADRAAVSKAGCLRIGYGERGCATIEPSKSSFARNADTARAT